MIRTLLAVSTLLLVAGPLWAGEAEKSPLDELPPYIERLTEFGQRADFSHDGKRILFMERTFGDVFELDLDTRVILPMTHHFFHEGFTRALYLANGDILLSGAKSFDATNPMPSRWEKAELWVLKRDLSGPPTPLGAYCFEGPAVSRHRMHIAWTHQRTFYEADIVYDQGAPRFAHKREIPLDPEFVRFLDENKFRLETQNFRPPNDKELTFTIVGGRDGTEVGLLDLATGKVKNCSEAPGQYDEPEGIFPDGEHTLIECDAYNSRGDQDIDIYKLALDGSGKSERITYFGNYGGHKASNPVVSDDGRFMAFQYAKKGDAPGTGRGLLLLDFRAMKADQQRQ